MADSVWGIARSYPSSSTSERLIAQIRALAYDVQLLLRATAQHTGDTVAAARARTESSLRTAQQDALAAADILARSARASADSTVRAVRSQPLLAVAFAFGAGLALGVLTRRR
jgi:ElaB/YqjD/DUF883 family membrane-anchored ribosome-binding protein